MEIPKAPKAFNRVRIGNLSYRDVFKSAHDVVSLPVADTNPLNRTVANTIY